MKRLLQLAATALLTWVIVRQVGVTLEEARGVGTALPDPHLGWLVLASVTLLAGFVGAAGLWGHMVADLGGTNPGWGRSLRIVLTANLGRYLPGKIWQMAGLAALARRHGGSATEAAAAGVLTQGFALCASGLLAIPLLWGGAASEGVRALRIPLLLVLGVLALAIGVPAILRRGLALAFRLARLPARHLPSIAGGFGLRWLFVHLLLWGVYGLAFLLFLRGLGLPGSFLQAAPAFAAAYLLGYLAFFAPAGIGVREGFLIAFLRPDLGAASVGVAVLSRLWMTIVEVVPAGIVGLMEIRGDAGDARGTRPAPDPKGREE